MRIENLYSSRIIFKEAASVRGGGRSSDSNLHSLFYSELHKIEALHGMSSQNSISHEGTSRGVRSLLSLSFEHKYNNTRLGEP